MSLLPTTRLETMPTGTVNKMDILNANLHALEAIFSPDTDSGDHAYQTIAKGLLKTATLTLTGEEMIVWRSGKFVSVAATEALTSASSVALDFTAGRMKRLTAGHAITFTTSNRAAGRAFLLAITCDGTPRTVTWPGGWKWSGTAPSALAAGSTTLVLVQCFGTADSDVVAGVPGGGGGGGGGGTWTWLGAWSVSSVAYSADHVVAHNGSTYLCTSGHTSASLTEPGVGADWATVWALVAQKGDTGATGAPGANGTNGTNGTNGADGADGGSSIALTIALARGAFRF